MKAYTIIYATNEGVGSFAMRDKRDNNMWFNQKDAEKVLQEIYNEEIEYRKDNIFESEIYTTNAKIIYEDDTWAEYRIIQSTIPSNFPVHTFEIEREIEENIEGEYDLTDEEIRKIRGFIEDAYFKDEANLDLYHYCKVICDKLEDDESVEDICAQSAREFLCEVEDAQYNEDETCL